MASLREFQQQISKCLRRVSHPGEYNLISEPQLRKPGNWVDYHINPPMKKLPSFIQNTDNMLQKIEKINENKIINNVYEEGSGK